MFVVGAALVVVGAAMVVFGADMVVVVGADMVVVVVGGGADIVVGATFLKAKEGGIFHCENEKKTKYLGIYQMQPLHLHSLYRLTCV